MDEPRPAAERQLVRLPVLLALVLSGVMAFALPGCAAASSATAPEPAGGPAAASDTASAIYTALMHHLDPSDDTASARATPWLNVIDAGPDTAWLVTSLKAQGVVAEATTSEPAITARREQLFGGRVLNWRAKLLSVDQASAHVLVWSEKGGLGWFQSDILLERAGEAWVVKQADISVS